MYNSWNDVLETNWSMCYELNETRQQSNKQHQEQSPVAARTRTGARDDNLKLHNVTVEEGKNSTQVFSKYNRRIILPTQSNCPSTKSILKNHPKYTTEMNMPSKKK
jgi:hypothetical protein